MPHQDFEKYAQQRPMNGEISSIYISLFEKKILPRNNNSPFKVLDFGCGDGRYFLFFKKYLPKKNIYGVEISHKRILSCKRIGWNNVKQIKTLQKLPFRDNCFDFINFDQVIEHIKENEITFYIQEFKRILKPNGKVLVITPNYPIKRIYDFLNALKSKNIKKIKDDPTHVAFYNISQLQHLFLRHNFHAEIKPTGGVIHQLIPINFTSHKIIGICTIKK